MPQLTLALPDQCLIPEGKLEAANGKTSVYSLALSFRRLAKG